MGFGVGARRVGELLPRYLSSRSEVRFLLQEKSQSSRIEAQAFAIAHPFLPGVV